MAGPSPPRERDTVVIVVDPWHSVDGSSTSRAVGGVVATGVDVT
jgi:hypothetical protein